MNQEIEDESSVAVAEVRAAPCLEGFQRKHLRGLAHELKPLVHVGRAGVTPTLITSVSDALDAHELVKIKFLAFKDTKRELVPEIASAVGAAEVGLTGHVAILFRPNVDPERRKVVVPRRATAPADSGAPTD